MGLVGVVGVLVRDKSSRHLSLISARVQGFVSLD